MARWQLEAEYTEKYSILVDADSMEGARERVKGIFQEGAIMNLQTDIYRDYHFSVSDRRRYVKANTPKMVTPIECQWDG